MHEVAQLQVGRDLDAVEQRQPAVELSQSVEEPRGAHPGLDLRLRVLHGLFVPVQDLRFLTRRGARTQPQLLRDQRVGEVKPRIRWTPLQGPRNEQQRAVGHEQARECGGFRHQPPALEGIGTGRLPDADVILGEQPGSFITRVPVVAAQAGDCQFQREHRGAAPVLGPGTVRLPEAANRIG
jgi:hypothetical protein